MFALSNFGVNLTRLRPGAMSALRRAHSIQDEFVYDLQAVKVDGVWQFLHKDGTPY